MAQTALPIQPFDNQVFIDAFRVKWIFDAEFDCWRRDGPVPNIPSASALESGLLTAGFKQLLDGISAKGGHFGIITHPLLSSVPVKRERIDRDSVQVASKNESGSQILGVDASITKRYTISAFAGKLLVFVSGILKNEIFLIFDNTEDTILIDGDVSQARLDDKFEIIEPEDFNPSGVLFGDIELISETIDISCVDGAGNPITVDCKEQDKTPPSGLDFAIGKVFKDRFCVEIPGCAGPDGDRGAKGKAGKDGAGDGPKGDAGATGEDAAAQGKKFAGIKITDVDDIFDTAVVRLELDAAAGKLNIIRAKARVPDDDTPADQLIVTAIHRSVEFTDDEFGYVIHKPNLDPIGVGDVNILHYPSGSRIAETTDSRVPLEHTVATTRLSELINAVIAFWQENLDSASEGYDLQIKEFIDGKDAAARIILANLAQELAECEWQLPIEFCIGLQPDDCTPGDDTVSVNVLSLPAQETDGTPVVLRQPNSLITSLLGSDFEKAEVQSAGTLEVPSGSGFGSASIPVTINDAPTLPAGGYVIEYVSGAVRGDRGWIVGSDDSALGLKAVFKDDNGNGGTVGLPSPASIGLVFDDFDRDAVEAAYKGAPIQGRTINIILGAIGTIKLIAGAGEFPGEGCFTVRVTRAAVDE